MPTMRITVRNLEALKPPAKETLFWDEDMKRFGLRVQATGRKVFVVQYERHGKTHRVKIGEYGRPWTVEKARKEAQTILGRVAQGEVVTTGRGGALKLSDLYTHWIDKEVRPHRKPRTIEDYQNKWKLYIEPKFGDAYAADIQRPEVIAWHTDMAKIPRTANYALTVLSGLMNFGIDNGLLPRTHVNPAYRIQKFEERQIERFLSKDELARIGQAIRELETEGRISMFAAAAIRLLIYTGARSGEIKTLRWDWVDLERATIFLPVSKTGKKAIHLNDEAMAVLHALIRVKGNPYVCVGQRESEHIVSLRQPWLAICDRARVTGCRIHDLRHSFASFAVMGGLSLHEVGKLLGHKTPATTQRYAHLADSHSKQNNQSVGTVLGDILNRPDAPSNVVKLRGQ